MSLSAEEIESVCEAAAGKAIVATYCGYNGGGDLKIVAKGLRRAPNEQLGPRWGGNAIDGPALKWLANQKGRRVWWSDGIVTGKSDITKEAIRAASRWATDNGIIRLAYANQVISYLRNPDSVRPCGVPEVARHG